MKPWQSLTLWVTLLMLAFAAYIVLASLSLRPTARDFPLGVGLVTMVLLLIILAGTFNSRLAAPFEVSWEGSDLADDTSDSDTPVEQRSGATLGDVPWRLVGIVFGGLVAYAIGVLVVGFTIATPLYVLLFLRLFGGASWTGSIAVSAGTTAAVIGLTQFLRIDLYPGILNGAQVPPF